jgi:hypothetical protein
MAIDIVKTGKTAEEAFVVSDDRAAELFDLVTNMMSKMTNPTDDLLELQAICKDDSEFVYAVLHYGIATGRLFEQHSSPPDVSNVIRKMLERKLLEE